MPPRAPVGLISLPSALSPLRFFLGELRRELATPPKLSSPSPAKPARQKLRQSFLYLGVTSLATVEHG